MKTRVQYYLHHNLSFVQNYFGYVGIPFEVSYLRYLWAKMTGYRTTVAPAGTSLKEVMVIAAIKAGAHPTSYRVQEIRKMNLET